MLRLSLLLLILLFVLTACSPPATIPEAVASYPDPLQVAIASPLQTAATPHLPEPTSIRATATLLPTRLPSPTSSLTADPITTLLFTGVIVPARCVQAAIDASGNPDYPYEEVRGLIEGVDIAVGTLNATISDFPPRTGCVRTYVLVGGSDNADALARAGFDVMSVATNHIKNCGIMTCGDKAFLDTLDNLNRVGILPVGAGLNHDQAMQPVVVEVNGVRFGFVSLGQIEPMAFAGEDKPGIAVLNSENLENAIQTARQVSDVVIALPHWGPEDMAKPNGIQLNLARQIVDAGADLVVGNHTHVVQAIQVVDGIPVFYGLGNFVFDQSWARDHQQGVILLVRFQADRFLDFELIPTHVDGDGRVHIAAPEEAREILERIDSISRGLR